MMRLSAPPAWLSLRPLSLGLLALLAGCAAVGPDYHPLSPIPAEQSWQAALPHGGSSQRLVDWWGQFDDPLLLQLIESATNRHPTAQRALAVIQEARATLLLRQADGQPKVNAAANLLRRGDHSKTPVAMNSPALPEATLTSGALDAQWELDLFGGMYRATEAATARLQGRHHSWHEAQVTLAAEVASKYLNDRACRLLQRLAARELASRQESAQWTEEAVRAGLTPGQDLHNTATKVAESRAALTAQQANCDLVVKSLVSLTGLEEPALRRLLEEAPAGLPRPAAFVVESLPSQWLAQRPDLAALEREVAASSADIGVAAANRYPRMALSGNISLNALQLSHAALTTQPWSLGPVLLLPLLDGGARSARVEEAEARYRQAEARYRAAIRAAVEEVESALVTLESARRRTDDAQSISRHAAASAQTTATLWQAGGASLLLLAEAQRAALQAERAAIIQQREQVQAWITLYKALGGGWQGDAPPSSAHDTPSALEALP
ncbi:MAG: efflux transporter outer membrane subunit [Magnetococcales bacterium]|nr:efflux transporter outer membrane subunit [Magnetococcales bacterium]